MKYVIANWKMNLTVRESEALVEDVLRAVRGLEHLPDIVLCPSATALFEVAKQIKGTQLALGAQNVAPAMSGAMTGEVGISELEDMGCKYVILGHSERRAMFGETDELVRQRLSAVLASSLTPIVCVGETAEVRAGHQETEYVLRQIKAVFANQPVPSGKKILVAYEPIWAIDSGTPATPAQAVTMHRLIREAIKLELGVTDEAVAVVYGGSVDAKNAQNFFQEPDIDGALVGGASLQAITFSQIIEVAGNSLVT